MCEVSILSRLPGTKPYLGWYPKNNTTTLSSLGLTTMQESETDPLGFLVSLPPYYKHTSGMARVSPAQVSGQSTP